MLSSSWAPCLPVSLMRKDPGSPPRFGAGTPDQVQDELTGLAKDLSVEEVIIQDMMTDHEARLRSYDLLAEVFELKDR